VEPSWSISTEAGAYLLFPFLATFTLFRSAFLAGALLLACVAVLAGLSLATAGQTHEAARASGLDIFHGATLLPFVRCLAGFTIGLIILRLSRHPRVAGCNRTWYGDLLLLSLILVV